MACSDDPSDQLAAVATIRGICSQAENRRPVFQAGILDALTLGTRADDPEIKYETSMIFNSLSLNDDTKLDMAKDDQFVLNLIDLLRFHSDPRCMRQVRAMF